MSIIRSLDISEPSSRSTNIYSQPNVGLGAISKNDNYAKIGQGSSMRFSSLAQTDEKLRLHMERDFCGPVIPNKNMETFNTETMPKATLEDPWRPSDQNLALPEPDVPAQDQPLTSI